MKFSTRGKIVTSALIIGAIGLAGVSCSSAQTQTQTITQTTTQAAKNLILNSDTVIGGGGTPAPDTTCVLTSQFKAGSQVVFRVKVFDPATGQQMDDKAVSSVIISLPDGQTFTAKYGGHPSSSPIDSFWTTSWTIPQDYPSGTLGYTVTATAADGRSGTFDNFNVQPSLLTVVQ